MTFRDGSISTRCTNDMCEEKKLKIGIAGLGEHMFCRLLPLLSVLSAQITAVCDRREQPRERFRQWYQSVGEYTDIEEMLCRESLAGVICAGDAGFHYAVAKAAMNRGISAFVEKTPCETYAQALELAAIQEQTGRFAMVGFNRRFTTAYQMAKEIIGRREFGRPLLYMAKYHSSEYPSDEYFLFNHVIHHLDLARFLMGEIAGVEAKKVVINPQKVAYHIHFITAAGAMGFIESSSLQQEPYPMARVEITGDGCNVIVDNVKHLEYNRKSSLKKDGDPVLLEGHDALCWNYNHGHSGLYGHYGFERELQLFVQSLFSGQRPESNIAQAAGTMEFYEKIKSCCVTIPVKGGA